jgi:tripartite-type tricarboxylate transporter receptor subunit TctC
MTSLRRQHVALIWHRLVVMAGQAGKGVDARDKRGHDEDKRPGSAAALTAMCALALALVLPMDAARSQTARTVKFVVPFPAGGGADLLTRVLVQQIGRAQNVGTIIENRAGGGSLVGIEAVSRAAPDGNTVLVNSNSYVVHPILKKVTYDPLTSFEPVCLLATSPQVVVVNVASPYRSLADLIEAARARPGELSHASVGPGAAQHIAFEQLKLLAKVRMNYIPFNGNAPAINALLGGHVTSAMVNYSEAEQNIIGGKLRPLAVGSPARLASLPEVPTIAESGYKGYDVSVWFGLVVPAKTPKPAVDELAQWCRAAVLAPELKPNWAQQGLEPVGSSPAEFAAHLRRQQREYADVVRDAGIKGEK